MNQDRIGGPETSLCPSYQRGSTAHVMYFCTTRIATTFDLISNVLRFTILTHKWKAPNSMHHANITLGDTTWLLYTYRLLSWFMRWIGHQSCANHSTDPQPMTQIIHPHGGTYISRYVVNIQQQLTVEQTNE